MIKIINNFFTDTDLLYIKNYTTGAFFTPKYFDDAKNKTRETYYGLRHDLINSPKLLKKIIKIGEEKFNIKILKVHDSSGIDRRKVEIFQPHKDTLAKLNLLVMLQGPTAINNGTVFYTDNDTDIHIGFKENRAVLFPSNYMHSPSVNKEEEIERTTTTLFITEYISND